MLCPSFSWSLVKYSAVSRHYLEHIYVLELGHGGEDGHRPTEVITLLVPHEPASVTGMSE